MGEARRGVTLLCCCWFREREREPKGGFVLIWFTDRQPLHPLPLIYFPF
jgi:hypothetical protein